MAFGQDQSEETPLDAMWTTPASGSEEDTGDSSIEERLRAELEEADRDRVQFKNMAQRIQADFQNFRRRTEEQRQEASRAAGEDLILRVLPVLDDLELALARVPDGLSGAEAGWQQGVHLVAQKFQRVLEDLNVESVEADGKPFDPWEQDIVSYQEVPGMPDGQVLAVVRRGYKYHGKLLRPALVTVAKAVSQLPGDN
jgi:molecular chaperone GrpE